MFEAVVVLAVGVLATVLVGLALIETAKYARIVRKVLTEPPARAGNGSVSVDLLGVANVFRARGFSDPQAVLEGTEAEPVVTLVLTDPTSRFDLRLKELSHADPPASLASAVSWFPQAQLATSNKTAGGFLHDVVQTCFGGTPDDVVVCHRTTLEGLHAVEVEPSQVRAGDAAQRYLDEWERQAEALRGSRLARARVVMLLWRATMRIPRFRAPVETPDDIVRLGALLGSSPRPER